MKKNMNVIGMIILITLFLLFYLVANFFLGRGKENKQEKKIVILMKLLIRIMIKRRQ